jgi:hypothetical protein
MKLALAVVVVLAACQATNAGSGDDYPTQPGGLGGTTSPPPGGSDDAGTGDGGSDGGTLTSRVCVLSDLRLIAVTSACAPSISGAVKVTLGAQTAVPDPTGAFTINVVDGTTGPWIITGLNLYPTVIPYTGPTALLPSVTQDTYGLLQGSVHVTQTQLEGAVIVHAIKAGVATMGVTATSVPVTPNLAFYDGSAADNWSQGAAGTSSKGTVWFPDIPLTTPAGLTATINLTVPNRTNPVTLRVPVPVQDQSVTFVTQDVQ